MLCLLAAAACARSTTTTTTGGGVAARVAGAPSANTAADSADALAVFRENLNAIHTRNRARYLATYLQTPQLTRTGLRGNERGWEGWGARTQDGGWPDTLMVFDMQVAPVAPGVVYGTYRYIGVNGADSATGISMRVLVRTPQGMRIAVTGSWPDTLRVAQVRR
jgi:hypothetical protein